MWTEADQPGRCPECGADDEIYVEFWIEAGEPRTWLDPGEPDHVVVEKCTCQHCRADLVETRVYYDTVERLDERIEDYLYG